MYPSICHTWMCSTAIYSTEQWLLATKSRLTPNEPPQRRSPDRELSPMASLEHVTRVCERANLCLCRRGQSIMLVQNQSSSCALQEYDGEEASVRSACAITPSCTICTNITPCRRHAAASLLAPLCSGCPRFSPKSSSVSCCFHWEVRLRPARATIDSILLRLQDNSP